MQRTANKYVNALYRTSGKPVRIYERCYAVYVKRNTIIAGVGVLCVCAIAAALRFNTPEDLWVCQEGEWVAHGVPSAPRPITACGDPVTRITFDETGQLLKNEPGLKAESWYLKYEHTDGTKLASELAFDTNSRCISNGSEGKCPDVLLPSSAMTHVRGNARDGVVHVIEAITGS